MRRPRTIPAQDLLLQYRAVREEIDAAIARVLRRGIYILDEEVAAFEGEFAAYCGSTHAVAVGSGTDALHLALRAYGIGPGDEVITVAHTSVATVAAVRMAGARPVLVDIEARYYTMDPERLEGAITSHTRAIVPVHLYGCPADLGPILAVARRRGLIVVEDCAQAHGAVYRGRRVGTWGDAGIFSFYPTKNLGAYGDAGAVVCSDSAIIGRIRLLRQYGWSNGRVSAVEGFNSRMDELQAAVLRVKLRHLAKWNKQRRDLAALYTRLLKDSGLILPVEPDFGMHVFHLYVVRHPRRDVLKSFLEEHGVRALIHYPLPIHLQPAYRDLDYPSGSLPGTERAAREVLSLPLYPGMPKTHIQRITESISLFRQTE
jgi:dTDP-3-amino-3,4,6-trideoxy-alpha-D-glucose transaminase